MKKKVIIGICILLALALVVPVPLTMKDGGSVAYTAVLYQMIDLHMLNPEIGAKPDYIEGTIVEILGMEVYNDVEILKD